jgi:hypothetical protein
LTAFVETLAPTRCNHDATDAGMRNPITGIAGYCARAASGHVAAAPPSSVTHGRRPDTPILGPYPSRVIADAMLRQPRRGGPADPQKGFRLPPMGR